MFAFTISMFPLALTRVAVSKAREEVNSTGEKVSRLDTPVPLSYFYAWCTHPSVYDNAEAILE
jgi:hypothetical protein